ncbi:Pentatricopeptide repeat-containing protein [Apostasia shenzhenica]|uniref:Pentatricopeptide repeat-containing protein n=1 Tax=Apostasia shenzhenica TaxID=1088818 RepID=A0A2I0BB82_9ASPA|nr:Pentatricopeptide repeat-containing protein [Apostasia shenzhenica]
MSMAKRAALSNSCLSQNAVLYSLHHSNTHYRQESSSPPVQELPQPPPLESLLHRLSSSPTHQQFNEIHAHFTTSGPFRSTFAANHLLHCSCSFLSFHLCFLIFSQLRHPDIFSYNTAIKSLSQSSNPLGSLLYANLLEKGIQPNEYTLCFLLDCCSHGPALLEGRQLHAHLLRRGLNCGTFSSTALINMYGDGGALHDAYQVFDEMPRRSNVSWGAMINAFLTHGKPLDGWRLLSILSFCKAMGKFEIGRAIHGHAAMMDLELNVKLGTSLIDLYCNFGEIGIAMNVFAEMPVKNVAAWNCLIGGMAINGHGAEAVKLFEEMKQQLDVKPNGVTFLVVLQACSHTGLVEKGVKYFLQMTRDYKIAPGLKHYGCLVDLYGKAGRVREAVELTLSMPIEADTVIWVALFSACRTHGYWELGELMAAKVIKLVPDDSCGYLLLSDAYAVKRRWDDVLGLRRMMREMTIKKMPGLSSAL